MKIGIMSMQRIKNYGSFLQAYSLKKTLEARGNEVVFVDYRVNESIADSGFSQKYNLKNVISYFTHRSNAKKRKLYETASTFDDKFEQFFPELGVPKEANYNTDLDLLVIGSDEVFNCYQTHDSNLLSEDLFGKTSNAKKTISYAASFGNTTLDLIKEYGDYDLLKKCFEGFSEISVRDKNSFDIICDITNKEPIVNLDPVFIYDYQEEMSKNSLGGVDAPYMVVYGYRGRLTAAEGKIIKSFAKKKGLKLIALEGVQDFCDDFFVANPFEVLNCFKNAEYVVTDTFHGTVFSIKFNKKFATVIRDTNSNKLSDLLDKFDFANHMLKDLNDLEHILEQEVSFDNANRIIAEETKKSKDYLYSYC